MFYLPDVKDVVHYNDQGGRVKHLIHGSVTSDPAPLGAATQSFARYHEGMNSVSLGDQPFPDRLSVDPASRHYDEALLGRNVGIKLNGVEYTNVEEYCISEGWIRTALGKTLDRRGKPLTITRKGLVEPFFKD